MEEEFGSSMEAVLLPTRFSVGRPGVKGHALSKLKTIGI